MSPYRFGISPVHLGVVEPPVPAAPEEVGLAVDPGEGGVDVRGEAVPISGYGAWIAGSDGLFSQTPILATLVEKRTESWTGGYGTSVGEKSIAVGQRTMRKEINIERVGSLHLVRSMGKSCG